MRDHKQLFMNVLGSLIATAIWAVTGNITKVKPLWVFGVAGFIAGCGITFSGVTWWLGRRVHCAERVEGSQFGFLEFVQEAEQSIFAIGPTLDFIARESKASELIRQKLAKSDFSIWLLIADAATADLFEPIGYSETFIEDWVNAKKVFTDWSSTHKNLIAKTTLLITASLIFVDADQRNGKLIITPLPWRVSGRDRPCFMLSKEHHPIAFNTYYNAYRGLFRNSKFCKPLDHSAGVSGPG